MKKTLIILISIILLTGCSSKEEVVKFKYPELYSDGIAFETGSYVDENDDDAMYATIEYNERTYMPYGSLKSTLKEEYLSKCIGYLYSNYNSSETGSRVFTLVDDDNNDYLMLQYVNSVEMQQPMFFRAIDTKGKEIETPSYIESIGYNFWK